MAKTVLPHTVSAKAGLAQGGLFTIPWSLRHCRKGLCHRIAAQDVPAVLAVVLKSGLFSPCLHVATGLLHLFAETFDHFRLSAWFSILVLIAQPLHSCGSDASISGLHLLLNKSSLKKEETFPLRKLFTLLLSSSRVLGRNSPPFASTASLTLRALNASPSFRHGVHRGEEAVRRREACEDRPERCPNHGPLVLFFLLVWGQGRLGRTANRPGSRGHRPRQLGQR